MELQHKQKKIIAIDLDDVICTRSNEYEHLGPAKYDYCEPIQENIDMIYKLWDSNQYEIVIYTARGMSQFNGDVETIYIKLYEKTKKQLDRWKVPYDDIVMGKIHYDVLIDDKALNSDRTNFSEIIRFLEK